MSWHKKMTDTQKAAYIGLQLIFDDIDTGLKYPIPRGAYSYKEHPEWYIGRPLQDVVLSSWRE